MSKIQFEGVRKVFQGDTLTPVIAIDNIEFSVGQDEFIAIGVKAMKGIAADLGL